MVGGKEENIWRKKSEQKNNGVGEGGKYLEKENIFFGGEGKGGKYFEKENILSMDEKKNGE